MTKLELKRIQNALKHQHEVSIKFGGNIIVIGTYKNVNTKLLYYCIEHDIFFDCAPSAILVDSRKGCIICSGRENWTTESIIKRIQFLNQDSDGNNTLVIDEFEYKNINQEIWLTCLIDGHKWKASIGSLIHNKSGCLVCYNNSRNSHLRISFDELHRRNNEINTIDGVLRIIIRCTRAWWDEHYKNSQTKIPVGCNDPDHPDWWVSVSNLLNNESGCPECGGNTLFTIEKFFNRIPPIFLNENGKPLHKYNLRNFNGLYSWITIFDPKYGWFSKQIAVYLKGYGHPNAPKCKSRGELAVQEFLLANQIKFMREHKIPELPKLSIDFYLIEEGTMIEFDGIQHLEFTEHYHETIEDFYKQQQNDRKKDQWCHDNGIKMIRITEIKDIPTQLEFLIK